MILREAVARPVSRPDRADGAADGAIGRDQFCRHSTRPGYGYDWRSTKSDQRRYEAYRSSMCARVDAAGS